MAKEENGPNKAVKENSSQSWFNSHKTLSIIGGVIIILVVIAGIWGVIHPRVYGTYYGYIDGKKNVKLVIDKDGKNKKLGYIQFVSSSDTGKAMKDFTTAFDKNERSIREFAEYDKSVSELKKLMDSSLYKNYLSEAKVPVQVVKHNDNWYLQYRSQLYEDAGYSRSDLKDLTTDLFGEKTYTKDNKVTYGFKKFIVGPKDKNLLFYRGDKKPNDPEDWASKSEQKKLVKELNEATDELNDFADMMKTMKNLSNLDAIIDAMDNGTASEDSMSDDSNVNSDDLEDASTEDVSFNPVTMKDQLVFE